MSDTARNRIFAAFLEQLETVPFNKIKVSALIKAAGVNRSTFYRCFENTDDLMECITENFRQTIAVGPPFEVTDPASLERYAEVLFELSRAQHSKIALLSGKNGNINVAYRIAEAVKERLTAAKNAAQISDPAVDRCLRMASPTLSLYFITAEPLALDIKSEPPVFEIEYDRNRSMVENVSMLLSKRLGGSPFFHYDLLCAYIKLDAVDVNAYCNISVTQLLATAGIARTEFYKYYKNIGDFFAAFEDACVYCALYWLASFLKQGWPDERDLNGFLRSGDVRVSIKKFFVHGKISSYYPKILFLVFGFVNGIVPGGLPEEKMLSFSYHVTVFAYAICTYLIGMNSYESLKKTFAYLQKVRIEYGV